MGEIVDIDGEWYYFSDGAIAGIVIGAVLLFIVIPILCCCCLCGWCCFGGRNKNKNQQAQQVQIYQPPPQAAPGQSRGVVTQQSIASSNISNVKPQNYPAVSNPTQPNWHNSDGHSYGQGYNNGGYAGQLPTYQPQQQAYPLPTYNPQQYGQYQSNQYPQSYPPHQQDNRIPRNHLGQTHYDIYEPSRTQSPQSKLPRPQIVTYQ